MKIPANYVGIWHGLITDVKRKNKYNGEIELSDDNVKTTYSMVKGVKKGDLTLLWSDDGFLAIREMVGKNAFTLILYLDMDNNLRCVWRSRSGFNCDATMTRVQPTVQTLEAQL